MMKQNRASKNLIVDAFANHVSAGKTKFFRDAGIDFVFGRREGPFVWDIDESRRLIDCHCNGGVFNLGHRHPRIVQALQQALQTLDIGNHHFISQQRAELAAELAAVAPGDLQYAIFGVSGGEAIDLAIKVARKATGRRKIISARGAYHGHTGLALAAGEAKFRIPFLCDAPDFQQVPFNDTNALAASLDDTAAAVIFETIPATLGMPIPDADYFAAVKRMCENCGALLIIDEIQAGFGRTGKLWGIEHYGVNPDIMVLGKGFSGGIYPITATLLRPELETVFHDNPFAHISTFGGAELACSVAVEVLHLTAEPGFLQHVQMLAKIFQSGLAQLQQAFTPLLAEIRQNGLMIGLKLVDVRLGPLATKCCFDAGLLCVFAGNDESVVQFLPPLIINEELAAEILDRLDTALGALTAFAEQSG